MDRRSQDGKKVSPICHQHPGKYGLKCHSNVHSARRLSLLEATRHGCKPYVSCKSFDSLLSMCRIHVYADLKAYICIHPLCDQSFEYYHLWAEHVLTSHFPELKRYCLYCNSEINSTDRTSTRNAFVEHLVYNHWDLSDAERTAATLDTERFILAPFNSFTCSICRRKKWKTWFEFAAHMARHLEEISLAALPEEIYSLDESPAARKHRLKKRQPDAPTELADNLELSLNRRQHKHHEDEEETEPSEEDPGNIRLDRKPPKMPLPPVKKPHRGSLRPRKVHGKVKESKQDQEGQEEPTSSPHVKFEEKSRDRDHRKHASLEQSPSKGKAKGKPVQQFLNEEVGMDVMRSYYKAYQDQYEKLKAGGQVYEGYGYPAAYAYPNYYQGSFPYVRDGYDYRLTYSGHGNNHANCRCQTCAAMREEYFGE